MLTIKLTNTSAGLIAIQRALAGEDITFTKLDIGDGVLTNLDISNFTGVINKIKDYPLGVVKPEGQEMVRLRANINNVGITEDKAIREFGLYAKFGSSEQEFLFAYMNTGDIPTALPSSSGGRYDLNRDFVLYIGSSTNVTFDTNGDLVYSTLNDYKALEAQKEDKFSKNTAFNKDYGVSQNQVLEGHRMAQIQGVEKCGGDVQTPGVKKVGYSYWCTANKDFYVCKVENSLNYIDDAYFDAFSNYSLLGKLQSLENFDIYNGPNFRAHIIRRNRITVIEGIDTGGASIREIVFPDNYKVLYVQLTALGRKVDSSNVSTFYSPCLDASIPVGINKFAIVPRFGTISGGNNG
ncbi:MAG: hypothetical protein ACRC92_15670, partial [Peptostreptococcaceae bacterium]